MTPATLSDVARGQTARLVSVEAGPQLRRRLAELGLTTGQEVTVVQRTATAMVLALRGGRTAVSREIAEHVAVEPADR